MASEFFPIEERDLAGVLVLEHARRTDVYVGCAPRTRRAGTKDAVGQVWTLWAECDGAGSVEALQRFDPLPAFVIGSGSGVNCHAYWPLAEPLTPPAAEAANLRLATALGADLACFDASRILRPPGTWNHKHRPPTRVATLHLGDATAGSTVGEVLRNVPTVNEERLERRWRPPVQRTLERRSAAVDRARGLRHRPRRPRARAQPQGRAARSTRTARPSLHVFPTPERGWCCFSCGRGGSIYDLAAGAVGDDPARPRVHPAARRAPTSASPARSVAHAAATDWSADDHDS